MSDRFESTLDRVQTLAITLMEEGVPLDEIAAAFAGVAAVSVADLDAPLESKLKFIESFKDSVLGQTKVYS